MSNTTKDYARIQILLNKDELKAWENLSKKSGTGKSEIAKICVSKAICDGVFDGKNDGRTRRERVGRANQRIYKVGIYPGDRDRLDRWKESAWRNRTSVANIVRISVERYGHIIF